MSHKVALGGRISDPVSESGSLGFWFVDFSICGFGRGTVAEPVLALNLLKFLPVAVVCVLLFIGRDKAGTVRAETIRRSATRSQQRNTSDN